MTISPHLIQIESWLDASVQRVGLAVKNMRELAVDGLPSSTPGNGSPGGGKGGGRSLTIDTERVPVSSVEAMALAGEADEASTRLHELRLESVNVASWASIVVEQFTGARPIDPSWEAEPMRLVVHAYRCARILVHLDVPERWAPTNGWSRWERSARRVWQLTQSWGWVPAEPASTSSNAQREMLATDLTGNWCRSCLRVGERKARDRNSEFCTWCRKFEQREGFLPQFELVKAHHANEFNEQMVIPFRQAHRARQKKAGKR